MTSFPIDHVRNQFPSLDREYNGRKITYFDGPGGTQMSSQSLERMNEYIRNGMANLHGSFITSMETDNLIDETKQAVANLLGVNKKEIAFGANMTTLSLAISRGLAKEIQQGDEIIVTELDHRANVDPWVRMAEDCGAVVKFISLHPETFTLNLEELGDLVTDRTKVISVGMSSNVTGTVTDIKKVSEYARKVNAILVVDAVHAVPHLPIDFKELRADILLCSGYKFFGPHVGIAVIREALFEKLTVYKLKPAPAYIPDKLETGTQNHEGIAGLRGAIEFIESLGAGETSRERIVNGIKAIDRYENELAARLEEYLRTAPGVTLYRTEVPVTKTPTFAFTIEGVNSREFTEWFASRYSMCIADGDFYASTMAEKLDVYKSGGWIRIGLAPYNTLEEVNLFIEGMKEYLLSKVSSMNV
jgi:cysteine desulfurase family protein (TIGR01976 family)